MKKLILTLVIIATYAINLNATVWTVNNNPDSPGQFTNLQTAIDSAAEGDTLYVSGSGTSYGNILVNKQLVLFGAGYNPNNGTNAKTMIGTLTLNQLYDINYNLISDPSGTKVYGFSIGIVTNQMGYPRSNADNITLKRNSIGDINIATTQDIVISGLRIINNVLETVNLGGAISNVLIANNIIKFVYGIGNVNCGTNATGTITNNIFLGPYDFAIDLVVGTQNMNIQNNIYYGTSTAGTNYTTFLNNISFSDYQTTFDYANNTAINNIENQNPLFENVTGFTYDLNNDDYHLQAGSPGKNAGSDGTDMGIYGGGYPWPEGEVPFLNSPMPFIPQVVEMNINNPVVPVGSALNVHLKAVKQN